LTPGLGSLKLNAVMARSRWPLGLVALVLAYVAATPTPAATAAVWEALRVPGSVVVLRHSYAPGTFDPPDAKLDDCTTQRNLDATGQAQARRIGEAFRRQGIAVGRVLSSPRCRCMDTARLAFGRAEPWAPLGGSLRDTVLRNRQLAEIRATLDAHTTGPPLVLVTHGSVVSDLTGEGVPMGAFVVLRRAVGGFEVVGQHVVE
jgi:broad specificity phosphatase PhoE